MLELLPLTFVWLLFCVVSSLTVAHSGYLSFGIYCILVSCGSSGWITAVTFMAI